MEKVTLIAALTAVLASSALAQSSFDGTYDGVSRVSGARPRDLAGRAGSHVGPGCPFVSGVPVPLTIRNGVVHSSAWSGTVDSNGAITMQNGRGDRVDGNIIAGTFTANTRGLGASSLSNGNCRSFSRHSCSGLQRSVSSRALNRLTCGDADGYIAKYREP
jgi:hypothetical protein